MWHNQPSWVGMFCSTQPNCFRLSLGTIMLSQSVPDLLSPLYFARTIRQSVTRFWLFFSFPPKVRKWNYLLGWRTAFIAWRFFFPSSFIILVCVVNRLSPHHHRSSIVWTLANAKTWLFILLLKKPLIVRRPTKMDGSFPVFVEEEA